MDAQPAILNAVCLGCGRKCDDLSVSFERSGHPRISPDCSRGAAWWSGAAAPAWSGCSVDGSPATSDNAIRVAAELLTAARRPLVCGLAAADTESQRLAIKIAELLGGVVDWTNSAADAAGVVAKQTVGACEASFGEIAQRAELVIGWQCDLASESPRLHQRLRSGSPNGRRRTLAMIGATEEANPNGYDLMVSVPHSRTADATNLLRQAVADPAGTPETDSSLAGLTGLFEVLRASARVAIVYSSKLKECGAPVVAQLTQAAQAAQPPQRIVTADLGGPGNASGAQAVMAWQTGYPMAVCFARGVPEYGPIEYSTEGQLNAGEADAALVIGEDGLAGLSSACRARLGAIPTVTLTSDQPSESSGVRIGVPRLGREARGAVFRADGVALPIRQPADLTAPARSEVLSRLAAAIEAARRS